MAAIPKKTYPLDYCVTCSCCGELKLALGNFYRNGKSKTGFVYTCHDCERQRVERAAANAAALMEEEAFHEWSATCDVPGQRVLDCYETELPDSQVIYALLDPRDDAVRYVGRTGNPKRRYSRHIERDRRILPLEVYNTYPVPPGAGPQEKELWVRNLRAVGLLPEMRILERVLIPSLTLEREVRWICHFLHQGAALLNVDWPNVTYATPLLEAIRDADIDYLGEPLESPVWRQLLRARFDSKLLQDKWMVQHDQGFRDWKRESELARRMYCAADIGDKFRYLSDQRRQQRSSALEARRQKRDNHST